jgi:hypothetical protein
MEHHAAAISVHLHHQSDLLPVLKQCVRYIEQAEKKNIHLEYMGVRVEEEQESFVVYLKLDGPDRTVTGNLRGKEVIPVLRILFDRLIRAYAGREVFSHVSFL